MTTTFYYRGNHYTVSGWLWAADGAANGLIVTRVDGRPIRGAHMRPGMVQIGVSRGLERSAMRALEAARTTNAAR